MARSQRLSRRKVTGSKYVDFRKKRLCELGSSPTLTKLADSKRKSFRVLGGNVKTRLLAGNILNLRKKDGTYTQAKILTVANNPANSHFVVRNILTKGAIVKTDLGNARITNRPGQEGTINAVLVD
jgi:small subunit ribosomal protein S8e